MGRGVTTDEVASIRTAMVDADFNLALRTGLFVLMLIR